MRGNFWTQASAARCYSEARPYFHPFVMDLVRKRLGLKPGEKLKHGIDIGCGTGQSTTALLELAESATGIDNADQMLAHAKQHGSVEYRKGSAEKIPCADASADIVTASLAIHWFDLPKFLAETERVLRPGGWLVSYSNGFRGELIGTPAFHTWSDDVYQARYPAPPRPHYDPPEDAFAASNLELLPPDPYTNEITFSPERLVAYLMTQSNIIAKVEHGTEAASDVEAWLSEQVRPFFSGREEMFVFGGSITYARLRGA